ncbi:hypothetical protein [Streptomyces sp. NBC_01022]|uniref:hypothetical protein n=1 Tax=Streptomyces sp. NBC_01022 TaxID=2903723 RepID=UPI002DD85372|nr:hypothetical protein [Streptomyces sp. NBC_01022]WRZ82667.1 hypothetical protein OG316_21585 [Streptomyces sp. NBC_01022]
MGRRLATAVHLEHPTTHELLILQPGEVPDEDVAEAITNPDAWETAEEVTTDVPQETPASAAPGPEPVPEPVPVAEAVPDVSAKPAAKARARKATEE